MRHMLSSVLKIEGFGVHAAADGKTGIKFLKEHPIDVVLCDLKMPGIDGLQVLEQIISLEIPTTIIMMSAFATVDTAVKAMKKGAYDFVIKPFKTDDLLRTLKKAIEREKLKKENVELRSRVKEIEGVDGFTRIVHQSSVMNNLIQFAKRAALHDSTILITGESGTGKELFAKGVQSVSSRSEKPFISINCGAIPHSLLESELFGYVKGAFTGADKDKTGIFAEANGGTLFLDEIGELPLPLQVKLLRVLQEKEIRPVGSNENKKIDVRVIAATAKDLVQEVKKGIFRQDLLFRLNVIELQIPPLRERSADITALVNHFIRHLSARFDKKIKKINEDVFSTLIKHNWPGNVRELENMVERAVVCTEGDVLNVVDFPQHLRTHNGQCNLTNDLDMTYSIKEGKRIMERHLITKALDFTDGNKSQAALLLEISYPSLLHKIKEHNI